MRRFAISDIHGCNATFGALLEKISFSQEDELYLLGDYIDRGTDSKGVIDRIWALQKEGYQVKCLKGNHEQMMLYALLEQEWRDSWLANGGMNTLASFGALNVLQVPEEYLNFLATLPHYLEIEAYIFVHAGLNFTEEDPLSDENSMLWIRDWYQQINYDWLGKRYIVHGHTPMPRNQIEFQQYNQEHSKVLNIDAGCVFVKRPGKFGHLCASDLTNHRLYFQPNIETAG